MVGYSLKRFQLAPWEDRIKDKNKKSNLEEDIKTNNNISTIKEEKIWKPNINKFNIKI